MKRRSSHCSKENADLKQENDDLKRFQLNPEVVFAESKSFADKRIDVMPQSGATDKKKGRLHPFHTLKLVNTSHN